MVIVHLNLDNLSQAEILKSAFKDISNEFEFTANGIFRKMINDPCPECGATNVTHNGYNTFTKKGLGSVKAGKVHCPECHANYTVEVDFFERLKKEFFDQLGTIALVLKKNGVSDQGISDAFELIHPCSGTRVKNLIDEMLDDLPEDIFVHVPETDDYVVVHYDEQYVKVDGNWKFRLTLLNADGEVIGEELFPDIKQMSVFFFLSEYLDPKQKTFIVTDLAPTYPAVFDAFFEDYLHQYCLFHLNKLIVKEFPRNGTMADEYLKYRFLNIFYDRQKELDFIEQLVEKENEAREDPDVDIKKWLKKARKKVRRYIHKLKKERRRAGENLTIRWIRGAKARMRKLFGKFYDLPEALQQRLMMMAENWDKLTAFYSLQDAPTTNNRAENFFSRSAKTHQKRQFRANKGVETRLKLTIMRIHGLFKTSGKTLLELFLQFVPFRNPS